MADKKNIFIIDVEENFCFLAKQHLEESGKLNVEVINDPDKGISLAHTKVPHVILLNIDMPDKKGLHTLEILKQNLKTMAIPIIMLTAQENSEMVQKAQRLYGGDVVVKPVEYNQLKTKVQEIIEKSK